MHCKVAKPLDDSFKWWFCNHLMGRTWHCIQWMLSQTTWSYNIISNKHPDVLALKFGTLQRCTGTEHMYCGSAAPESKGLIVSSHEAVMDELGCAASWDHKVMILGFSNTCLSQQPPYAASVTRLCLHWYCAQLSALLIFSPHQSQVWWVNYQMQQWMVNGICSALHFWPHIMAQ